MAQVLPGPRPIVAEPLSNSRLDRRVGVIARRIGGGALLVLCTALSLSLLTWSLADPSLTHAASGGVRNWMGPLGAIVSDLLMQMLGVASIFAVFVPAYWALQLVNQGYLPKPKLKLVCAPVAIVCMALAWSSLPLLASWPIKHGYGGMLGDLVYGRLVGLLSMINATRAGAAAGLFGLAVGLYSLQRGLGITNEELRGLFVKNSLPAATGAPTDWKHWFAGRSAKVASAAVATVDDKAQAVPSHVGQPLPHQQPPQGYRPHPAHQPYGWQGPHQQAPAPMPYAQQPVYVAPQQPVHGHPSHVRAPGYGYQPPAPAQYAQPRPHWVPPMPQPVAPQVYQAPQHYVQPQSAPAPIAPQAAHVAAERMTATDRQDEPAFDLHTDEQSRKMAERFAPMTLSIGDPRPAEEAVFAAREPEIVMPALRADLGRADHGRVDSAARSVAVAPGGFFERLTGGMRRHEPLTQHYKRPSLNLLKRAAVAVRGGETDADKLRERSRLLLETLSDFGIKGEITAVRPGPVVTLFEFEPARGTKSSRVIGLADDIARSMSARAVRIAVVPGVNAIGIELPNAVREGVALRDLLETDLFRKSDAKLPLALGKGIGGDPVVADLARMPHLLVAGTTGAGKSVGVNAMILSLLYQLPPEECRLIMIDPKMLELSVYNGIPHLLTPVVTDPNKAVAALNWAVGEMESRYKRMSALSVRNIEVYNNRVKNAKKRDELHGGDGKTLPADADLTPMAHIVIVVDEFADLMAVAGKEIEFAVQRLAQMARAAGIHLIMATQRPSVDIITGTIKANFPTRISFRVASRIDSRTILNEQGAEQLLGQGDMLYAGGTGQIMRVHGPFVSDEEVEAIADYLRSLGTPDYVHGITDTPELEAAAKAAEVLDDDDLYDRAVALVRSEQKASTSYLQRRLSIGYNRAADIIERMEQDGLVGPANAAGKRDLLSLRAAQPEGPEGV